jgi:iron complex transport system substrate-binding protein
VAAGAVGQAEPINLTDMKGRPVNLAGPAERIASIPFPLASTVIAFDGSTRHLVGMNPGAKTAMVNGIFVKMFPDLTQIPTDIVGQNFMPNVEGLAAIRPDLVLQWGNRGDDIVKPLVNAGLTTMLIVYGQERELRTYMGLVAKALGKPERVEENVRWRDKVLADLASKFASLPPEKRPRVVHLSNGLSTFAVLGQNDPLSTAITAAGGVNAAVGGMGYASPTNLEQIAAWDPDVITLNDFEDGLTAETIYSNPVLSLTKAARNKRVYKFARGGYRWEPPSHESPLGWMWLANILHPEMAPFDLRAETKAAYKAIYGYEATEDDLDGVFRLTENAGAADYGQFKRR